MISAVGFREDLVRRPAEMLEAGQLVLVCSPHPKAQAALKELKAWAKKVGIPVQVTQIHEAYDFVEWHTAWVVATLTTLGKERYVNLTAGHAVAISTASLQATKRALPCVCWDDLEDKLHHLSPSVLLKMDDLGATDADALRALAKGPRNVGELVESMGARQSTVSHCLERLAESGFLTVTPDPRDGRRRIAELRPGVSAFLESLLRP